MRRVSCLRLGERVGGRGIIRLRICWGRARLNIKPNGIKESSSAQTVGCRHQKRAAPADTKKRYYNCRNAPTDATVVVTP